MLVSIVIPHFERLELLKETLLSVQEQTCPHWEVIVVDDGSCEATFRALQELASSKIKVTQRTTGPKGPSSCRNIGIREATGELVLFLDSDDLLAPFCLEQRLRLAGENPDLDMWVFPVELFRKAPGDLSEPWNDMQIGTFSDPLRRFLVSDPPWCVSSPLWKRNSLLLIEGFNERVMYGDDADLHIRALMCPLKYEQYPEVQPDIYIRRSDTSRITNSCTPTLLDSRRTRLAEGSMTLRRLNASEQQLQLWEGQYFVEGEFLVFTQEYPNEQIRKLYQLWLQDYPGGRAKKTLAFWYWRFCSFFRKRFYMAVRIARKLALVMFPKVWFPSQLRSTN